MNLSQGFMVAPTYWRTVPFREFALLVKRLNHKSDEDRKKPRVITDKKGRKRRIVPVKD